MSKIQRDEFHERVMKNPHLYKKMRDNLRYHPAYREGTKTYKLIKKYNPHLLDLLGNDFNFL